MEKGSVVEFTYNHQREVRKIVVEEVYQSRYGPQVVGKDEARDNNYRRFIVAGMQIIKKG